MERRLLSHFLFCLTNRLSLRILEADLGRLNIALENCFKLLHRETLQEFSIRAIEDFSAECHGEGKSGEATEQFQIASQGRLGKPLDKLLQFLSLPGT